MPIKSVSINQEMEDFLRDNSEISLSTIIQSRLIEIMEFQKKCSGCLRISNLTKLVKKYADFVISKGLEDEFNKP